MRIVVCMKWVPRRLVVDPLTAGVEVDSRTFGPSSADEAALELALTLAAQWSDDLDDPINVEVVTAGPAESDALLREALAKGASKAIRCPAPLHAGSAAVAAALASVCRDADLVVCGDHSADRGSGSVPAFIAAELDSAQVLGVVAIAQTIDLASDSVYDVPSLIADRRLDRGRRERLRTPWPAVLSVEGSVVLDGTALAPRRASLPATLAAADAAIEPGQPVRAGHRLVTSTQRPHRPRTKVQPPPSVSPPHQRILDITKATDERTPPKTLHVDPSAAADAVFEALRSWGYLDASGDESS